jgi:hydrogenase-1 operon protein HyaE
MNMSLLAAAQVLHPLLLRLVRETHAAVLTPASVDAWLALPGAAMLVFADEPERSKETLDLAVIVPELWQARHESFRVGLLPPEAARALAPRFGFARWPAVVLLRDCQYLGAVDGIRDWQVYLDELDALLAAPPSRPPGIGVAVRAAEAPATSCH